LAPDGLGSIHCWFELVWLQMVLLQAIVV
jgi:hypothetical protein